MNVIDPRAGGSGRAPDPTSLRATEVPTPGSLRRPRQADEWIGLLVLACIALFVGAVLQAGVLRDWLKPSATLRVLLPEAGVGGLSVGADLEVLGTKAGTVKRVVIEPDQRIYAEVQIEDQARIFVRRDSTAVIRKRFGVAGAAFLDVARGTGPPLDWEFAVIEATTERAPTETISAIIDQIAGKVLPILEDLQKGVAAMARVLERVERGEGSVGRLMQDDALAEALQGAVGGADAAMGDARRILASLERAAAEAQALAAGLNRGSGAPGSGVAQRTDAILGDVQRVTRDLARTTPRLPQTVRNIEEGAGGVPALLLQTQQTARELETLLTQIRGLWLLGGGGAPAPAPSRPGSERLRP